MIGRVLLCVLAVAGPVTAQVAPRPVSVGIREGLEFHRGGAGYEHAGLQAWFPLRDRFELVPALDLLYRFPDDPVEAWSGWAWSGYLTVRTRLFGKPWLPDLGYGLTATYTRAHHDARALTVSSFDLSDTAVLAFTGPRWRVRPYGEIDLVNILGHWGELVIHAFFGLRIALR